MKRLSLFVTLSALAAGCGIYTFSGSTLPSHLKTVDIPLLENRSMEPDIADEITQELNRRILADNLLRIVATEGDATISGSITSYLHEPYTFGAASTRQVSVDQYIVKITAQMKFLDKVKDVPLFEGAITGEGIYDFQKETEETGRAKAIKDIVQRILQSSLQSW
ncbi:MAG: LptE family protein [Chitinispirillaceae bacterium]|nr:LptE family protein [Chitinispirillaceae bacterium]